MGDFPLPSGRIEELIREGGVIPAHPLALTRNRKLDERHQRALTRYYLDAGVCGLAVGVHTTQFEIRDTSVGLLKPVLELARETATSWTKRPVILIAGVCGDTQQACGEAGEARELGYHVGLLALRNDLPNGMLNDINKLVDHVVHVAEEIPLMGFYLQEAVGGIILSYTFWRRILDDLPNLLAIKVAPFNRYRTCDVVRALRDSGRKDVVLYTGNDDNIIADLITPFDLGGGETAQLPLFSPSYFAGGLLGQWAVWTRRAVEIARQAKAAKRGEKIFQELFHLSARLTDANSAIFDAANNFAGCIPGINEILRRQGLLAGRWCLESEEDLSPGQAEEIDRVCEAYPDLTDNEFVSVGLEKWLK